MRDPDVEQAGLGLPNYSSLRAIFRVAAPAVLLNAAGPLTTVVQTGLLGAFAPVPTLAAFAAASTTASFATRIFNFLVDGVSAKVGRSVGARRWAELTSRVQFSFTWALAMGVLAAAALACCKQVVVGQLLHLSPAVQDELEGYWWLRVMLVPIVLLNMAACGILQGFNHVHVSAALNSAEAVLEVGGSLLVLRYNCQVAGQNSLFSMGLVTLGAQLLLTAASLLCILTMPPPEARGEYSLRQDWCSRRQRRLAARSSAADLSQPLLAENDPEMDGSVDGSIVAVKLTSAWSGGALANEGGSGSQQGQEGAWRDEGAGPSPVSLLVGSHPLLMSRASSETLGSSRAETPKAEPGALGPQPPTPAQLAGLKALAARDAPPMAAISAANGNGYIAGVEPELAAAASQPRAGAAVPAAAAATAVPLVADAEEPLLDFLRDGADMLVRSMTLQLTFFMALAAASHLSTAAIAAHSIIGQLWMLMSNLVDGFAAAGIVLGSRLSGHAHDPELAPLAKRHLERLVHRVLLAGLAAGMLASAAFYVWKEQLIGLFTKHGSVVADELHGSVWLVLVLTQPLNGLVWVQDGLMYASNHFAYIRNCMVLGFCLVFAPLLAAGNHWAHALWAIWAAKAAMNVWRACCAAYLIHVLFMHEFDGQVAAAAAAAAATAAAAVEQPPAPGTAGHVVEPL